MRGSGLTSSVVLLFLLLSGASWAEAPTGIPDTYATTEDTALVVAAPGVLANDLDLDGDSLIVSSVTFPTHGNLTSAVTSGAFSYEPDPGFIGTDSFTYILRDSAGIFSEPVTITIEVLEDPNRPPLTLPDHYGTWVDTPLVVVAPAVLANDYEPDGDAIIMSSVTFPGDGALTSAVTSGAFTYVPNPGFTGTDSFTYIAQDSESAPAAPAEVEIQVIPATPGAPTGIADDYATTQGTALAIAAPGVLANDLDPDGDPLIMSSVTFPANGNLTSAVTSGAFTYVPNPGFIGSDSFTYLMRDSEDNFSDPVTVTIQVFEDPNRPPVAIADDYGTPMDTPLEIVAPGLLANDFDPDGDSIIVSSVTFPIHGALTSAVTSGAFTYQPDPGFTGIDSFTYIARDSESAFAEPAEVRIHVVGPVPTLTLLKEVINDETGNLGPGDFTLVVTGADGDHDEGQEYPSGTTIGLQAGVEYTLSELPVMGYALDSIECRAADATLLSTDGHVMPNVGEEITCTLTNNDISYANFRVAKDYSDDNLADVGVTLTCDAGVPLVQSFTIAEGESVNFTVDSFLPGELDCTVTETPVAGYSAAYDNGSVIDSDGCSFAAVVPGQQSECTITNAPDPVDVVIDDLWLFGAEQAGDISQAYSVELSCSGLLAVGSTTPTASISTNGNETVIRWSDSGEQRFVATVVPGYPSSRCEVTQALVDSAVDSVNECGSFDIAAGDGHQCEIVNSVFFEGIPTLNRYGLGILVLLVLGLGLAVIRRQV